MADGDGCRCWASSAVQCGCPGVDWTPQELIDARRTIVQLTARVAELGVLLDRHHDALSGYVDDDELDSLMRLDE